MRKFSLTVPITFTAVSLCEEGEEGDEGDEDDEDDGANASLLAVMVGLNKGAEEEAAAEDNGAVMTCEEGTYFFLSKSLGMTSTIVSPLIN